MDCLFLSEKSNKFFLIGLGLGGPSSLSYDVIKILKCVDTIFFEFYTNYTNASMEDYELFLKKKIIPIFRKTLENDSKEFLRSQKDANVALLISGDPFIATTHYMLIMEAFKEGLDVKIYNNVSIYSIAPSITGLSAYKFGKTATIPFPERIKSETYYDIIKANISISAHSLVLLDIDVEKKEFLSISRAINLLLELEEKRKEKIYSNETKIIALSKIGSNEQKIIYDTMDELEKIDWQAIGPPQALIFPSSLNVSEQEILEAMWTKKANLIQDYKVKIVVTGTFDILHPGHLAFFQNAKKLAIPSELWVVVARNTSVTDFKKKNPILDEQVRVKMLNALEIVDHAILGNEGADKIKIIEEIRPEFIALGYDQWINEEKLRQELLKRGLTNTVVKRLPKFGENEYSSSTDIRKKIVLASERLTQQNPE